MTTVYRLREEAEELGRLDDRLTGEIEDTEKRIVDLRRRRDDARFHRAEALAAANLLDGMGFRVERDDRGNVTVSVDPPKTETPGSDWLLPMAVAEIPGEPEPT
jgi:hypothetical protein